MTHLTCSTLLLNFLECWNIARGYRHRANVGSGTKFFLFRWSFLCELFQLANQACWMEQRKFVCQFQIHQVFMKAPTCLFLFLSGHPFTLCWPIGLPTSCWHPVHWCVPLEPLDVHGVVGVAGVAALWTTTGTVGTSGSNSIIAIN